jgi:photosystem II stability/assembly factor-like uncharacterized protein
MKKTTLILLLALVAAVANAQHYDWEKLTTEPYRGKQDDICFVDELHGWYINGYGKIFKTTDAGKTWSKQLEQKGTFFRCIAFIDTLTGFVGTVGTDYFPNVSDTIPLYKTIDGGTTWTPVAINGPYVKGLCAMDIVKEKYINHGEIGYKYHIYGVGRVGSPTNFITSHDGGTTFTNTPMNTVCTGMYDIKMFNMREGIACASTGVDSSYACMLRTIDGGKNWSKVYESKRPFEIAWKVNFPTPKIGYATIQSYNEDTTVTTQHFIKTNDGGNTWKEQLLCNDYRARSFGVGFVTDKIGFIGTMTSGYATTNGGDTWTKTDMGKACNKIRIVNNKTNIYGYAIGVNVFKLILSGY